MDDGAPAEHPDHDLLADLAAQTVLSSDLAARVEAHVRACNDCADLLAEAEAVQAALRTLPPEPMPAEISHRIELALAAEYAASRAGGPVTSPFPLPAQAPGTGELPTRRSLRTGQIPISEPPAPSTGGIHTGGIGIGGRGAQGPATGAIRTGGDRPARVGRLRRMNASRQSSRRQALEEQRSDRPSLVRPLLRVAAGLAAILVVGTGAYQVLSRTGSSTEATSGASSAAPPILAPVLSTGTDYDKASLAAQVKTLVGQSQHASTAYGAEAAPLAASGDSATSQRQSADSSKSAPVPAPSAAPGSVRPAQQAQAGASSDLLRSSSALRACLSAIGEPGAQPVAVDLARYRGRDAAILVLPGDSGHYNVWVVARDCAPQRDGTLDFVVIPS